MTSTNPKSSFLKGIVDCSPFILVVIPFGTLFGVVATEAGLNLAETMVMTFAVFAGAAQFTALSLMIEQAPMFIVILTALAVNLRMAMYSAALVPHFGNTSMRMRILISYFMVDQSYAVAVKKFDDTPNMPMPEKISYYFGTLVALVPLWVLFSYIGAIVGNTIPPEFSLDFALPICFIALTAPMMRSLPHFAAALVSVVAALALIWVPFNLGLIIAAIMAMMVGARIEIWLGARQTNDT